MTKHSSVARQCSVPRALISIALGVATLSQWGCQRSGPAAPEPTGTTTESPNPPAAQSIELSAAQLAAIRVDPAQMREFAVESETVGSISFDEDPAVVQSESALLTAAANFEMSRRELARVQSLGEENGIAPKELEGARAAEQAAAAALEAARSAARALGVPDAQIDRMARTKAFDALGTGAQRKWLLAYVPENDSPRVHRGQTLRAQVPAFPDHWYPGRVEKIYSTIDPETHRLNVRARLEDPKNELRPGMLATVVIRFAEPARAVAIPTTAAVRKGDGSMVAWVTIDRRHFSERHLQLGPESQGSYPVVDGLKAGELVVTEGGVFLSNMLEAPPSD
jgi:membrane fusion protein, heavy metal efflux system